MERFVLWHRLVPTPRDEHDDVAPIAEWTRTVVDRILAARGEVTAAVGAAVAADFDPADAERAMELALQLLHDAGAATKPTGGVKIAIGAGFGSIEQLEMGVDEPTLPIGGAYDRAQLLANRAKAGELVLDPAAREHVASTYLFGRTINVAGGTIRGVAVDRARPRREACRGAIRHLEPAPVAPSAAEVMAKMQAVAERRDGIDRILLRGMPGSGASEWVTIVEREVSPPLVLRIGAVPGGLEPLGSLRLGLVRLWRTPGGVVEAARKIGAGDPATMKTLEAVSGGRAVERSAVVSALVDIVDAAGSEKRPWIVLDPLVQVDPATVECVAEATADGGPAVLLIARLPPEVRPPSALADATRVEEIEVPKLRQRDARAVAEAILGPGTAAEVSRRVAVLGGESTLGVVEAARTLIASGDLVHDGKRFAWRVTPRGGVTAIPVESLMKERLSSLVGPPMKLLEAVAVVPHGSNDALVNAVAELDGLREPERKAAAELLREEALLSPAAPMRPSSTVLRTVVLHGMPPARMGELHRWAAQALGQAIGTEQSTFRRATRAFFLGEGGLEKEGASELLVAARAAVQCNFPRSAVRLAAAAVQLDPSSETRKAVAEVTRGMSARMPAGATRAERVSKDTQPEGKRLELFDLEGSGPKKLPKVTPPPGTVPRAQPEVLSYEDGARARRASETGQRAAPGAATAAATATAPVTAAAADSAPASGLAVKVAPGPADITQPSEPPPAAKKDWTPKRPSYANLEEALGATLEEADDLLELEEDVEPEVAAVPAPEEDEDDDAQFHAQIVARAVEAIRARDFDEVERCAEMAIAAGGPRAAAERIRAMAQLARGDPGAAMRILARSRRATTDSDTRSEARAALALALALLSSGDPSQAIRSALGALASARSHRDPRGEAAALHTLAACYRALGRPDEAAALDEASPG